MRKPDVAWQRATSLRRIETSANELRADGVQFTDRILADAAAKYVGADVKDVLRWMAEDKAAKASEGTGA